MYLTWQDSRAGSKETESEDVYFAALQRDGSVAGHAGDDGVPTWLGFAAGVAIGLGVAMAVVGAIARRSRQRPREAS